jgi:hypothetical protein
LSGKDESTPWSDLTEKATSKLLQLAIDRTSADDWLAGGLLASAAGDAALAENLLEQARSQGADISAYLVGVAAASLTHAMELMEQEKFSEADVLLANIEEKYADTAWFVSNRPGIDAAKAEAKAGIYEAEAEKLYAKAKGLFEKEQLFDVKPLAEKLRGAYADSQAVTDITRKPSFTEMEKSVADLGNFITVRQDGKGDYTNIQAAIDAAPPNSLIEIQDNGPYNEKIEIQQEGLTVRGKTACWPIISSVGRVTGFPRLVVASARGTTIERLVLAHSGGAGSDQALLSGEFRVRSAILWGEEPSYCLHGNFDFETCALHVYPCAKSRVVARDCFWMAGDFHTGLNHVALTNVVIHKVDHMPLQLPLQSELRSCTIHVPVYVRKPAVVLGDCILPSVQSSQSDTVIQFCNVYRNPPFIDQAKPGKGCFSQDPQFVNPTNFDYRLMPTSPCIGKASDGGDIGCRFTPGMIEVLQKALELRAKGIIKF